MAHIVQTVVITIGDDGIALFFEIFYVADYGVAKESGICFQGGLINDHLNASGGNAPHYALDGGLTEIVRIALHG